MLRRKSASNASRSCLRSLLVEHADADFLVERQRARVEVGGADVRPDAVDDHDLLVRQRGLELVHAYAGFQQRAIQVRAGDSHERTVGLSAGHHQVDGDAALHHLREQLAHAVVGREVGVLDDHFLACRRDCHGVQQRDLGADFFRCTADDVSGDVALALQPWIAAVARGHAVRLFHPVLHEHRLQRACHGAFQAHGRIAPVIFVFAVAEPLIREAVAERVADRAVDDEELAMRAVIEAPQIPPPRTTVLGELDAGIA